jgi:hypothetical protein
MDWGLARDYAARDGHREGVPVTEAEWLAATDPQAMVEFLCTGANGTSRRWYTAVLRRLSRAPHRVPASHRKLRLFACACARLVDRVILRWHDARSEGASPGPRPTTPGMRFGVFGPTLLGIGLLMIFAGCGAFLSTPLFGGAEGAGMPRSVCCGVLGIPLALDRHGDLHRQDVWSRLG